MLNITKTTLKNDKENNNQEYATRVFWENKYVQQVLTEETFGSFDMYCPFSALYSIIGGHIIQGIAHRVLIIGVGRSDVIDVLLEQGFTRITAIDISTTLISKLQSKYEHHAGVEVMVMDVCVMDSLSSGAYSIILDKASIDAIYCSVDFTRAVRLAYQEICRVLSPGGSFFSVSSAPPEARIPYMGEEIWTVSAHPLKEGDGLHLYIATKEGESKAGGHRMTSESAQRRERNALDRPTVTSAQQRMNRHPRTANKQHGGTITVGLSLSELRGLVEEQQKIV